MARKTRTAFDYMTAPRPTKGPDGKTRMVSPNPDLVKVELLSTVDGNTYEFWDDGVNEDGRPGRFRAQLLAALEKERDGVQVYKAAGQLKPRFPGDMVPRLAGVADKKDKATIAERKPERERKAKQAEEMLKAKKAQAKSGEQVTL